MSSHSATATMFVVIPIVCDFITIFQCLEKQTVRCHRLEVTHRHTLVATMADSILLMQTADFAAIAHTKQRRKDNVTPYINHPIGQPIDFSARGCCAVLILLTGVANLIATVGDVHDVQVLQAALL
jgi:hypothetical protein